MIGALIVGIFVTVCIQLFKLKSGTHTFGISTALLVTGVYFLVVAAIFTLQTTS